MRIKCNKCKKTAIIQSTSEESDRYRKLYCCCGNPMCGHTFVMDLSFSHTLSPSAKDLPKKFIEKISRMTQTQQQNFFANL
ncbi:MAG: transcriptional regulator [Desulfobacteraceae bacterium]|nr:transcriptional regulator [Desulfobacteraceae bacterium]